jgi:hypothetical protein
VRPLKKTENEERIAETHAAVRTVPSVFRIYENRIIGFPSRGKQHTGQQHFARFGVTFGGGDV